MYLTKRQRQILDFIKQFIDEKGYSPSLEEIGAAFGLTSPATIHKHVQNLIEKGLLKRGWNRSRSIEVLEGKQEPARELPLMGYIAAGSPLEAVPDPATIALPWTEAGARNLYVLQVKGQSMIEDHIQDGDYVIIEERETAENGNTVVALLGGGEATLKRFYRENGHVRLQPANPEVQPILVRDGEFRIQGIVVGILRKY
ncbi:MAG: transcriptional repressor LexA [Candidatus Tectomicrobia bacterium]|nr:transcriptional repressor LexA [Candidatus Tectomicrobia bacterium]